jgi:hypothetical protein
MSLTPRANQWWTMDKRGEDKAHLVAAVKPDLHPHDEPNWMPRYDFSEWSPACVIANVSAVRALWSSALFSTFKSAGDPPPNRCMVCEGLVDLLRERTEVS